MEFQLINLLPSNWVHALGITLFHSLWVGTIMALVTSLIIVSTRKSTASMRYNLLTGVLGLFVVVMIFIFCQSLNHQTTAQMNTFQLSTPQVAVGAANSPLPETVNTVVFNKMSGLMYLWNSYAAQIVLVWFLIICAKAIQLMAGLHTVYYLKNSSVFNAGRVWEDKVNELSAKLGITQSIKLLQSGIAKVPMVAGHLKPVILIPLGMLNGLTTTEVEAILCHELAHVKRRDYLINILQSLIEIIFFFNPAVLWVSRLIKEERENCCDDLALSCTSNKKEYIKALISCQEFQFNVPEYAMGIKGKRSQLLERVSRMVFNQSSSLNKMEKTVLTLVLISTLIFTAAFTNITRPVNTIQKVVSKIQADAVQDTTKKKKQVKVTERKVSVSEEHHTDSQRNEIKQADQDAAREAAAIYSKEMVDYQKAAARYDKAAKQYAEDMRKYAKDMAANKKVKAPTAPEFTAVMPEAPIVAPLVPATPVPPLPPVEPVDRKRDKRTIVKDNITGARKVVTITTDHSGDMSDETDDINKEMLQDGVIRQTKKITYKLSENELVVNGVRQSAGIHKKYASRYLKGTNSSLTYTYDENPKN